VTVFQIVTDAMVVMGAMNHSRSPVHIHLHSLGHSHPYSSSNKTKNSWNLETKNLESCLMQLIRAFRRLWPGAMLPQLASIRRLLWLDVQLSWNAFPGTQQNICV
jgi:hypothetical protein